MRDINGNFGSAVQEAVTRAVALDLARPVKATDILWSSWEENGQFQAAVGVPHVGLIVRGAWSSTRSQAELAASHSALVELQRIAKAKGQVPVTISGAIPRPTAVVRAALPHAVRPGLVSVAPQIAPVMPLNGRAKICKYFMKGWCYDGLNCPMVHGPTPKAAPTPTPKVNSIASLANHPAVLKVGRLAGSFTPPVTVTTPVTTPAVKSLVKTELCSYFQKGWCYEGQKCPKAHGEEELGQPRQPLAKKRGRDGEDVGLTAKRLKSNEDTAEYEEWRDERLDLGVDPEGLNAQSLELWYAQICLICSTPISGLSNWPIHANGSKHMSRYLALGGAKLKDDKHRPDPQLQDAQPIPIQMSMYVQKQLGLASQGSVDVDDIDVAKPGMAEFLSVAGFDGGMVLSIGEQDFSFSRSIAKVQHSAGLSTQLVATSYLAEHDPTEPEVHVADDGERAQYTRKSLPSMGGALFKNLAAIQELGGICLHSVDATDLNSLVSQGVDGAFDVVVFAFPRASLKRSVEPRNSLLIRKFFRSVLEAGLLAPLGRVELLMLGTQYAEWDVACMAQEEGFELFEYAKLPNGFYQSRDSLTR